MTAAARDHLSACAGFGSVVARVGDRWDRPSPCPEWDARGVLEHVIGFHDVLVLRPAGAKPARPRHDPVARWSVTVAALEGVLAGDPPEVLPMLTRDVLVHAWDLSRAAGVPADLDAGLCRAAHDAAAGHLDRLASSGMFGPPVPLADPATVDPVDALVALSGRDPGWTAP